jgi:formyl-CoA transferase
MSGALEGLRVIDLSRVLGGPYCTQILGDHGADVIKIEPPQGDETREWGPPYAPGDPDASAYFIGINRNKQGMALDISKPAGREVLLRLLEDADILVENFKTGTMERWGLGFQEVLSERFPRLIHCRVSGFGADGPLGGNPGYDAVVQAMTGLISVNGSPQSGPVRIGIAIIDMATGMNAVIGILMAVAERARSGRGQFVEATLYDTGISLQHPHAANWFMSGKEPALTGNSHANVAPYDLYQTRTNPVFLGVGNDGQFRKCCQVLGRPELADDPRFRTNALRSANRPALTQVMTALLAQVDGEAFTRELLAAGVPAGPMQTIGQVLTHPHTIHRDMVAERDGWRSVGPPVKLGRTPASVRRGPPAFGADSRAVLSAAGYTQAQIDSLIAEGIVPTVRGKA